MLCASVTVTPQSIDKTLDSLLYLDPLSPCTLLYSFSFLILLQLYFFPLFWFVVVIVQGERFYILNFCIIDYTLYRACSYMYQDMMYIYAYRKRVSLYRCIYFIYIFLFVFSFFFFRMTSDDRHGCGGTIRLNESIALLFRQHT